MVIYGYQNHIKGEEMPINQSTFFHCPRWNELPEESLFNRQVVSYINQIFQQIGVEEDLITMNMVQNYSKWQMIPKMQGRKYHREHIAYLIVMTTYKQVLQLEDIKRGADLILRLMDTQQGYDRFAASIENALNGLLQALSRGDQLTFDGQVVEKHSEGIQVLSNAVALKLLGTLIIREDGLENLKEKYHV